MSTYGLRLIDARWLGVGGPGRVAENLLQGLQQIEPPGTWAVCPELRHEIVPELGAGKVLVVAPTSQGELTQLAAMSRSFSRVTRCLGYARAVLPNMCVLLKRK